MKEILERESKWEVTDEFALSALGDMAVGGVPRTVELSSQYFDTADRDPEFFKVDESSGC